MVEIRARIKGVDLTLRSAPALFSPSAVDAGTLAMLDHVEFRRGERVLDLGCGYGVVGLVAAAFTEPANVYLIDNDPLAVEYAAINAELNGRPDVNISLSDGFRDFGVSEFGLILVNPPYHSDFSVAKHFIEKGFNRLVIEGRMVMVTRRLDWYRNKLRAIFGGTRVVEEEGYYIFEASKRQADYARG